MTVLLYRTGEMTGQRYDDPIHARLAMSSMLTADTRTCLYRHGSASVEREMDSYSVRAPSAPCGIWAGARIIPV